MDTPIWKPEPKAIKNCNVTAFIKQLNENFDTKLTDTKDLWKFSIQKPDIFWGFLREFSGICGENWGNKVLINKDQMPGAKWFPDAQLNFAENLLKNSIADPAILFWSEDKIKIELSFAELNDQVSLVAQALKASGVGVGDPVVGCMANMPETVIAMLAAASLGAVWSSCSPDFGVNGIIDRFEQLNPKVLFAVDGYFYNGKRHDIQLKLQNIAKALPTIIRLIVVPFAASKSKINQIPNAISINDFISPYEPGPIQYTRLPFDHPLYVMFSSGTTGKPKCIIHSAGGTLIKHASEHLLHCNIKPKDRVFYYTTCGWMMWNWLVTNIAWGATILLYDGSPAYPDNNILFDFADDAKMTFFGTSSKFIDSIAKAKLVPQKTHDLSTIRIMASTGSPLAPESYDYVYNNINSSIHLASISGGTDILGTFCAGDPTQPVWRGEIQTRTLGMATDVFDTDGTPIRGKKGELVCTKPFPSIPLGFINDPDDKLFHSAYFEAFPGVWTHGDYVKLTDHDGIIIYGRSDATLNPGGVRIGTAEIYQQVEKFNEVLESIVIGQEWDGDTRIILFVILRNDTTLDVELETKIKRCVRDNCTPRHVPAKIIKVNDIPRTKSGKITELAVRDIVHGRKIVNTEALANPEALEEFKNLPELSN